MSKYNILDYCKFIKTNKYPFYFPVADANGNVISGDIPKPREHFLNLGLSDPKEYYMNLLHIH
jgi:hypothetical protein